MGYGGYGLLWKGVCEGSSPEDFFKLDINYRYFVQLSILNVFTKLRLAQA